MLAKKAPREENLRGAFFCPRRTVGAKAWESFSTYDKLNRDGTVDET